MCACVPFAWLVTSEVRRRYQMPWLTNACELFYCWPSVGKTSAVLLESPTEAPPGILFLHGLCDSAWSDLAICTERVPSVWLSVHERRIVYLSWSKGIWMDF